jgi:hypothetical protein
MSVRSRARRLATDFASNSVLPALEGSWYAALATVAYVVAVRLGEAVELLDETVDDLLDDDRRRDRREDQEGNDP